MPKRSDRRIVVHGVVILDVDRHDRLEIDRMRVTLHRAPEHQSQIEQKRRAS